MLATSVVEEIDRLLGEAQLSQRKIAARLGVSRGVVSAIATGVRGLHGQAENAGRRRSMVPRGLSSRCPRCGYKVYLPCLVCRARENRNKAPVPRAESIALAQPLVPAPASELFMPNAQHRGARVA